MDDPDVDHELIALLRESLGFSNKAQDGVSSNTGVLKDAEHIAYNAIDVSISMYGTRDAASHLYKAMRERKYSTQTWSEHELHPKLGVDVDEIGLVNFVFTMDLLNFSFWSEKSAEERYQVEYQGKQWTGYNSLVACLRRALDEGIPITTPRFWGNDDFSEKAKHVFRSATDEVVPLLAQRIAVLQEAAQVLQREYDDNDDVEDEDSNYEHNDDHMETADDDTRDQGAGQVSPDASLDTPAESNLTSSTSLIGSSLGGALTQASSNMDDTNTWAPDATEIKDTITNTQDAAEPLTEQVDVKPAEAQTRPDMSVVRLIEEADHSSGKLVNLLAKHFPCFQDEGRFEGRKVRFLKRAQIFVADLWAAFNGTGYGEFYDIEHITMFADYRVPQMLYNLGVITFSPPLESRLRRMEELKAGESWELQLRGCSIWAVEMIRRQIVQDHPEAESEVNAVLLDFLLYDLAKEFESTGTESIPHHRTRSIWY